MLQKFKSSLLLQIAAVFLTTLVLLGLAIIGIQRILVLDHLKEQALEQHTIVGRSISQNLNSKLRAAETLAASLANTSLAMPKDSAVFKKILPAIIDYESAKTYVAGGGVWPEPGEFVKGVDRHSFFWGRDQAGTLEYYDDYNDPKGNGYHNEEWYVPARHMKDDQCYWSKSYVDPYSYQPMVTCTIAIRKESKFVGVSTIDLKLEGLSEILSQSMKPIGGYAFALDRNNKFLAFPDEEKIQRGSEGATEVEKREYIDMETMIKREPDFLEIAAKIDEAVESLQKKNAPNISAELIEDLAQSLDKDSYQINEMEAKKIALFLLSKENAGTSNSQITSHHIKIEKDVFLKQPAFASVFYLPKTDWKLVLVTPTNTVLGTVNDISRLVALASVGVMVIILLAFFIFLQRLLMSPLHKIITSLKNSDANGKTFALLDEGYNNEIGQIARWYNLRTQQLINTKNEAERANMAKTEFLANMSHELRTPLNSILGLSNILQEEQLSSEQRETLVVINKSAENLLSIVNDILDISKIEDGRFILETAPLSIKDLSSNLLDSLAPLASKKGLCLNLHFKDEYYPTVMGDPLRIERVLTNLIGNAIKYTVQGNIDIEVFCSPFSDGMVTLRYEVNDTGIGIEKEKLPFIFEKFTQADETITRRFGGTGLGLYITKSLTQLMGGDITVSSEIGKGSCFSFQVPLKIAQDEEVKSVKSASASSSLRQRVEKRQDITKVRALVAEDHEMNIVFVKKLLKFTNLSNYDLAKNGAIALDLYKKNKYDIVLMDCHMPELSGYECTQKIREYELENRIGERVPIIAMTADAMVGTREKCLEAGMDDYISKPIDRQRFKDILSQWFEIEK